MRTTDMRRLVGAVVAVAVAVAVGAATASTALAAPQQQPKPNPWPANAAKIFFYVDTVTSGPGEGKVDADKFCAQRNFFERGMHVVFRMSAVAARTGKVLTGQDVRYAYIKIPGMPNIPMFHGKHGRTEDAPWFWTGAWNVPADYPAGIVDFRIVLRTKGKNATTVVFKQIPVAPAQLTITT